MTIRNKEDMEDRKIEIDLTGPDGNVFAMIGIGSRLCKQLGKDFTPIRDDMMSGNYEHAIEVFERELGEYVDIYR